MWYAIAFIVASASVVLSVRSAWRAAATATIEEKRAAALDEVNHWYS